jgi:ribosomal protein S12 methylthiotransferase
LIQFLEDARLDRVGAFAYSPVDGARANEIPGLPPENVREDRRRWLMQVQEDISADKLAERIDSVIEVLVDEVDEEGVIARSKADAPEIDGVVYLDGFFDAAPGDFLKVRVVDADHHDLYAEPAGAD